jgi:hypothetical protein
LRAQSMLAAKPILVLHPGLFQLLDSSLNISQLSLKLPNLLC